jgi:hypothetical protein
MTYAYKSLVDRVTVAELPTYDTTLRQLKDTLGYTFTYRTPEQLGTEASKPASTASGQLNWPVILLLGVVLAVAIPASAVFGYASKLAAPLPPSLTHPRLEGIGGWLFLVAFGLIFRPIQFVRAAVQSAQAIFPMETWQSLTLAGQSSYHPSWMPILIFELLYNSLAVVFSGLLLFFFFKKRAIWPRSFIAFFVFMFIGAIVDGMLGQQLPTKSNVAAESAAAITQVMVASLIWIPYSLFSQRVKATFRY